MSTQPRKRLYRAVNRELEQTSLNLLLTLNGKTAVDVPASAAPARSLMQTAVAEPRIAAFCIQTAGRAPRSVKPTWPGYGDRPARGACSAQPRLGSDLTRSGFRASPCGRG